MSLTVYQMPDGNIFDSKKEIAEHYGISMDSFSTQADDYNTLENPEANINAVKEAAAAIIAKNNYTSHTVTLLTAQMTVIDTLLSTTTSENSMYIRPTNGIDVELLKKSLMFIGIDPAVGCTADDLTTVRTKLLDDVLTMKIGLDLELNEVEKRNWEDYKLFMIGRDPEIGFEPED